MAVAPTRHFSCVVVGEKFTDRCSERDSRRDSRRDFNHGVLKRGTVTERKLSLINTWLLVAAFVLQLGVIVYGYGRTAQHLDDLGERVSRIEQWLDKRGKAEKWSMTKNKNP